MNSPDRLMRVMCISGKRTLIVYHTLLLFVDKNGHVFSYPYHRAEYAAYILKAGKTISDRSICESIRELETLGLLVKICPKRYKLLQ